MSLVLDPGEHGGGCTGLESPLSDPGECGGGCTDLESLVSDPGEYSGGCTLTWCLWCQTQVSTVVEGVLT